MKILRYIAVFICVLIAIIILQKNFPTVSTALSIVCWIFLGYLIAPKNS